MAQNNSEEMDLGSLWGRIKEIQISILLSFYRMLRFFIRNWITLLVLVIAGVLIGYVLEKNQKSAKEGSLIVQINFDASNYVYNSIEHLNNKISDNDTIFLKNHGFYKDNQAILTHLEIEPIVNIADILEKLNAGDKNLEPFLEQAQYEDNLLTSEIFIPEYKTHRILIKTTEKGTSATIENLLAYLNDNELLQQIKELTIVNTKNHIKQIQESVANIDSIAKKYGSQTRSIAPGQVYFNSVEGNENMHMLISLKNTLLKNNEEMEIELLKYNHIVTLLDNPHLAVKRSFFDQKMKILPVVFVLLFIVFAFMVRSYNKARGIEQKRNSTL